jgi:LysR family transcriptional regulator, regulator for bpeEF and oprC
MGQLQYTVPYMQQTYVTEKIRFFVKVVQHGSFTRAAIHLGIPKSTVSRAVRDLERTYAAKLLVRTTRNISLTAAGRGFYEACLGPIQVLEEAAKSLSGQDSIVAGELKITTPEDLGKAVVIPTAAELLRLHPGLRLNVHLSNDVVDMVRDSFDLAVRIGKLTQSSFRAIRAGNIRLMLVASPTYLKDHGEPLHPEDLAEHRLMSLHLSGLQSTWELNAGRKRHKLAFSPVLTANHMSALVQLATASAGIALVPQYLSKPYCASGQLHHVMPDWSHSSYTVSVVSPLEISKTARLKVCADQMVSALRAALE